MRKTLQRVVNQIDNMCEGIKLKVYDVKSKVMVFEMIYYMIYWTLEKFKWKELSEKSS